MHNNESERALYLALIGGMIEAGRAEAALAYLEEYRHHWPVNAEVLVLEGKAQFAVGELDRAERAFRLSIESKESADARNGLGRIAAARGDWLTAMDEFRQAVDKAPSSAVVLNNYGYALLELGQVQDAFRWISRAREVSPNDPRVRMNYLLAASRLGYESEVSTVLEHMEQDNQRGVGEALIMNWKMHNSSKKVEFR